MAIDTTLDTKNELLNAIGGTAWVKDKEHTAFDGALILTVFLDTGSAGGWSVPEAAQFDKALKSWSSVAKVRFLYQENTNNADLVETIELGAIFDDPKTPKNEGQTINGNHTNFSNGTTTTDGPLFGRYNSYIDWDSGSRGTGGKKFGTFVHEIGHALGLAHPHTTEGGTGKIPALPTGDTNPFGGNTLDHRVMTIMSYNGRASPVNYGQAAGPMALDIAAVQLMYGAVEKNAGDTVYTLRDTESAGTFYSCVWDTGGTDTIAYNGIGNATIDLRHASLANGTGGGGFLSSVEMLQADGITFKRIEGGFTIAADSTGFIDDENGVWGVIIERAIGGSGDDKLYGNDVHNLLRGGDGKDHLNGFGGADDLIGGKGDDEYVVDDTGDVVLDEQGAADKVYTSLNSYNLNVATKGAGIENLQFVGSGKFTGTGNSLNNAIVGAAGDDTLRGGIGNDFLAGGLGADTMEGGADNDTLTGEGGRDTLRGGAGDDIYILDGSADTIEENADGFVVRNGVVEFQSWGIDTVTTNRLVYPRLADNVENLVLTAPPAANAIGYGNTLNNTIWGNPGNNKLYGEAGEDHILGGVGNDTIEGGANKDTLLGEMGLDILIGGQGNDILIGGADPDTFRYAGSVANLGTDTVYGGDQLTDADSDILDFKALKGRVTVDLGGHQFTATDGVNTATGSVYGIEIVVGSAFDDTFAPSLAGESINGELGFDTVTYAASGSQVTIDLGANTATGGYAEGDHFSSIEHVIGSDWDDTITGSSANETLEGAGGSNHIYGMGGTDTLIGGSFYDWMEGGADNDIIRGTTGQTVQFGGDGDDTMIGSLDNNNYFAGGLGKDVMTGGNGADYMSDVDGGDDTMHGGVGADTLVDYFGANLMYGEGGNDFMSSIGTGSFLDGGADNDYLSVANGEYTLLGGSGTDTLEASGFGHAIFTGGDNADIFTYRVGGGLDYDVTDFEDGSDKILLWDFKYSGTVGFDTLSVTDCADGTVISWNGSFEMTLLGVSSSKVTQSDFVWA